MPYARRKNTGFRTNADRIPGERHKGARLFVLYVFTEKCHDPGSEADVDGGRKTRTRGERNVAGAFPGGYMQKGEVCIPPPLLRLIW